jgi:hypothetical protein
MWELWSEVIICQNSAFVGYLKIQRLWSSSKGKGKGNAIPLQALTGPEGSRGLRLADFKTIGT